MSSARRWHPRHRAIQILGIVFMRDKDLHAIDRLADFGIVEWAVVYSGRNHHNGRLLNDVLFLFLSDGEFHFGIELVHIVRISAEKVKIFGEIMFVSLIMEHIGASYY